MKYWLIMTTSQVVRAVTLLTCCVTARTTWDVVMISQYFISIRSFNVEFPDPGFRVLSA